MTQVSEEEVIAFVDGQLEGSALTSFEAKLRKDRGLVERVDAHRWMARQVVAAYGEPPADDANEALIARLGLGGDHVVEMPRRGRPFSHRAILGLSAGGALAASLLAVGILIGYIAHHSATPWLRNDEAGQLAADGVLADSLSKRLSGQDGPVRIGISFRTRQGVCRTFDADSGLSGLGCRNDGGWSVPIVVTGYPQANDASEYRLASGNAASSVMAEVDRRIVGEPLSSEEEKRLMAKDWR